MTSDSEPGPREVRWERMFPEQLEAAFEQRPVVYFGYGLCEPHGPHATLGLDLLKAHALLVRCARRHGGIVAPSILARPRDGRLRAVGGARDRRGAAVAHRRAAVGALPEHLLPPARRRGARLPCRHLAHRPLRTQLPRPAHPRGAIQPRLRMRVYGLPDFEANRPGFPRRRHGRRPRGQGGDLAAVGPRARLRGHVAPSGRAHLPALRRRPRRRRADAEAETHGRRHRRWLARKSDELLADWRAERPSRLRTFDDVERFWAEEMAPRLGELESMQSSWYEKKEPKPGCRWRQNWPVTVPR